MVAARRVAAGLAVGLVAIFGGAAPASAATPCEEAVARFAAEHAAIYDDAYVLEIACTDVPGPRVGDFDTGRIRIEPAIPGGVERFVAHEIGHAWAFRFVNEHLVDTYAPVRGFPAGTDEETLHEDYAEVFAYALGKEWFASTAAMPAPYNFQNAAGPPTDDQIIRLWAAGLLPEVPWFAVTAIVPD